MSFPQLLYAVFAILASAFGYFLLKGYEARAPYYKPYKQGMPIPPWHPIMGHLLLLPNILKRLPKDSQQPDAFEVLSLDFEHTDSLFYLDLWPFSSPFLIASSPAYAIQAYQQHDLPRPSVLEPFFRTIDRQK
ncbi:hypothetical protein V2W45_1247880 [Cenococcum geophilum]